jgi:YD repeat-containing protein
MQDALLPFMVTLALLQGSTMSAADPLDGLRSLRARGVEAVSLPPGAPETDGDPIHLGTGLYIRTSVDLALFDTVPVVFSRTYRNADGRSRPFGIGTNHSYGSFLVGDAPALTWIALVLPDGGSVRYTRTSGGTGISNAVFRHTGTPTEYLNSVLSYADGVWTIALTDGSAYTYPECAPELNKACTMSGFRDASGHWLRFIHDERWNLTRIETENDQWIELRYDQDERIILALNSSRQEVRYTYDAAGRLVRVVQADGAVSTYEYDDRDQMVSIIEPGLFVTNRYDDAGRCVRQDVRTQEQAPDKTMAERHDVFLFSYMTDTAGRIRATDVIRPDGQRRRVTYDATGYSTSDSETQGKGAAIGIAYERQDGTNALERVTVWCGPNQQVRVSTTLAADDPRQVARTTDLNPYESQQALRALLQERCGSVLKSFRGSRR